MPILFILLVSLAPACLATITYCYPTHCQHYNGSYTPCDGQRNKCVTGSVEAPEAFCQKYAFQEDSYDVRETCHGYDVCLHDNQTGMPQCVDAFFVREDEIEGWGYKCWNKKCSSASACDMEHNVCAAGYSECRPRSPTGVISSSDYDFCPSWKRCLHDGLTGQGRCVGANEAANDGFKLTTLQIISIALSAGFSVCGLLGYAMSKYFKRCTAIVDFRK